MATFDRGRKDLLSTALRHFVDRGDNWVVELFFDSIFIRKPDIVDSHAREEYNKLLAKNPKDYDDSVIITFIQELRSADTDDDFRNQVRDALFPGFDKDNFRTALQEFITKGDKWILSVFDDWFKLADFDPASVDENALRTKLQELFNKQQKAEYENYLVYVIRRGQYDADFLSKVEDFWVAERQSFGPVNDNSINNGNGNNNGTNNNSTGNNTSSNQNDTNGNGNTGTDNNAASNQNDNNDSGNTDASNNATSNSSNNSQNNTNNINQQNTIRVLNPKKYIELLLRAKTQKGAMNIPDIEAQCVEEVQDISQIKSRGMNYKYYDYIEEMGLIASIIIPLLPTSDKGYINPGYVLETLKSMGTPIKFSVKRQANNPMLERDYCLDEEASNQLKDFVVKSFKKYCDANLNKQLADLLSKSSSKEKPKTQGTKQKDNTGIFKAAKNKVIELMKKITNRRNVNNNNNNNQNG